MAAAVTKLASSLEPRGSEAPVSPVDGTAASAALAVSAELGAVCGSARDEPHLDANRLHVYHVALELHCLCSTLVGTLNRIVKDQLERASLSVVLNIAEAGGRRSRRDKARYYAIARGSATETAALLVLFQVDRPNRPNAIKRVA